MEPITYYTADELRASLQARSDDEAARIAFINEPEGRLIGGFYHEEKGDEWLVRDIGNGQYIVTGSDFERRYDDGLFYDEHITPRLMEAYEAGLRAKLTELAGLDADAPIEGLARFALNGQRTSVCEAYCHPSRAHKVRGMAIDDDEWAAVREVIARGKA